MRDIKAIKVMPDFTSSGIWLFKPNSDGDGMIDYDELKISKELANEFELWIRYYDTCFKSDYTTFKNKKMADKMNAWGKTLAIKLKRELPKREIWFWAEEPLKKPEKNKWANHMVKTKIEVS
jgi:hypothetical protein